MSAPVDCVYTGPLTGVPGTCRCLKTKEKCRGECGSYVKITVELIEEWKNKCMDIHARFPHCDENGPTSCPRDMTIRCIRNCWGFYHDSEERS
jgi:hypothetical protein